MGELDIQLLGIDGATYEKLLNLARMTNRSVAEVAAEALSKHLAEKNQLKESSEKKLLCEG